MPQPIDEFWTALLEEHEQAMVANGRAIGHAIEVAAQAITALGNTSGESVFVRTGRILQEQASRRVEGPPRIAYSRCRCC